MALQRDGGRGDRHASRTTAPASRRRTWRPCSSGSTPRGPRARRSAATRASASPSPARSSRRTAARCRAENRVGRDGKVARRASSCVDPAGGRRGDDPPRRPDRRRGRRRLARRADRGAVRARARATWRCAPWTEGFRLVADDRVAALGLRRRACSAARRTRSAGLIEVRGLGVIAAAGRSPLAEIALVVALRSARAACPSRRPPTILGVAAAAADARAARSLCACETKSRAAAILERRTRGVSSTASRPALSPRRVGIPR